MKKSAARSKTKTTRTAADKKPSVGKKTKPSPSSSSHFSEMVENAVQGILVHRNFKPLYANKGFATLFGYRNTNDVLALPLIRPLIPKDRWATVEAEYDDLVRGRTGPVIRRARGIKKDGTEIWMAITERMMRWEGAPAVEITAFDITSQMAAEHNLLESEQALRAILEILPYPIYITRPGNGQLLFVNRKTCLLFQQSANQLLRSRSIEFFADPKEREDLRQLLETIPDIRDIEVRMKTGPGRGFTAEMAAISMNFGGEPAILVALNDISQRKEMEAELFSQATTDELTKISNRRHFFVLAERELSRAQRFDRPLSTMMIDIDHFKKINDTHGHAIGDGVLQSFVKRALESLRQSDVIGRLGGEEFAVIMPETTHAAAEAAAERLRAHVEVRPLIADREAISVTVSVGVATFNASDETIDKFLHRADQALYRAKNNGRNRVEVAG